MMTLGFNLYQNLGNVQSIPLVRARQRSATGIPPGCIYQSPTNTFVMMARSLHCIINTRVK